MRVTEERNKPVDGRDVARRLSGGRGRGAACSRRVDSGEARDDRGPGAAPRSAPRRFRGRGLRAELTEHLGYEKGEPTTSARGKRPWAGPRPRPSTRRAGSSFETRGAPGTGPARLTPRPVAPWAKGGRGGLGLDDHQPVRRGDGRARDPPPLGGPPSACVPGQGGRSPEVTDAVRRCRHESGSAGLRVAFYPVIRLDAIRVKIRADHRVPGTPEPASPWVRGMDGARARGLGIWTPRGTRRGPP